MSTKNLIRWIDSHYPAVPTEDNGDGTLTISIECVHVGTGAVSIERSTVPATLAAAREVLGY